MEFKALVESEMIAELSQDGKWVTFKNGQHTYVGKDGDIETGPLKGGSLKNKGDMKSRFKKLKKSSKNR